MKTLEQLILDRLKKPENIFVFPTQVAARQWAEHILEIMDGSCGSVAMDRFIAWDSFKGESIRSQHENLTSVPSVLRQMFAASFIGENASQPESLLKSLIPEQFRHSADNYASWISSLLPQLQYWADHRLSNGTLPADADDEDRDLFTLYTRYREFLSQNNLFDPAWEKPPFTGIAGEHYLILYPDALSDFDDYRELLADAEKKGTVTLVTRKDLEDKDTAENGEAQTVYNYTNSRTELRLLALQLRKSHHDDGVLWNDMAVSVADTDTYGPYLTRELELYDIPYQYRVGKPLASRGAGLLFSQISDCVSQQFSYDSVKNLLSNPSLPWKEPEAVNQLIAFGQKNCCICTRKKGDTVIDPWEEAFKEAFGAHREERAKLLYADLKSNATGMVHARTFADIKKQYFAFREALFDTYNFTVDDDRVLSRCISELAALIEVEADYPAVSLPDAYTFFCSVLNDTIYVPQAQEKRGVHIYEYKAAAAAPFRRHFILDSSQSSLQVTFSRLLFLRSEKRDRLNIAETDASREYIAMYGQNSAEPAHFSCAEKTFGNYTIPHSSFVVFGDDVPKDQRKAYLDAEIDRWNETDPYLAEKNWYLSSGSTTGTAVLTTQAAGFEQWKKRQPETTGEYDVDGKKYQHIITRFCNNDDKRFMVSKSAVQSFAECPRKWYMNRILNIKEESLDAGLLDDAWRGTQLHRIMEEFFKELGANNPFHAWDDSYEQILSSVIDLVYAESAEDRELSPMSRDLIQYQKDTTSSLMQTALKTLVKQYPGYTVYGQEKEYRYTPESLDGSDPGYTLRGVIDLLLMAPDGETITMIDYKSGRVPSAKDCMINEEGDLKNLQFAMYKLLFEKGTRDDGNEDNRSLSLDTPRFFKLSDASFVPSFANQATKLILTEQEEQKILEYSENYAAALQTGVLAPMHQPDWSTCSDCAYKRICRSSFKVFNGEMPEESTPDTFFYDAR